MDIALFDPVRDPATYASELDLRYRVLRAPLGLGRDQVGFAGEQGALHVVATEKQRVMGCVLFDFVTGRLRAMAVDPCLQRTGLGRCLVRWLEAELVGRGVAELRLHARVEVVGFYEALGYVVEGAPFVEVGIKHQEMRKTL